MDFNNDNNKNTATEAISIKYDTSINSAPVIAAKGEGKYAEDIISMAEELGLYVHKDPVLFENLKHLSEGDAIPRPLYLIISEIIAYSFYLQGKTPERYVDKDGTHIRTNV
jgi:type III secretion system FlhB-like substrate exporter